MIKGLKGEERILVIYVLLSVCLIKLSLKREIYVLKKYFLVWINYIDYGNWIE